MIYLKDHHEAIIDRDTWNKTQFELARRSSSKNRNQNIQTDTGVAEN